MSWPEYAYFTHLMVTFSPDAVNIYWLQIMAKVDRNEQTEQLSAKDGESHHTDSSGTQKHFPEPPDKSVLLSIVCCKGELKVELGN